MNPILIMGTAPGWREDVRAAVHLLRREARCPAWDVCAINFAGVHHLDPIQHWVSIHGQNFDKEPESWLRTRHERGGNMDFRAHTSSTVAPDGVEIWPTKATERNGTSGLLAVILMHKLGYERIILCGVHLIGFSTDHGGLDDARPGGFVHHQKAWIRWADEFRDYTRSMGGWTSELLGYPTVEWVMS